MLVNQSCEFTVLDKTQTRNGILGAETQYTCIYCNNPIWSHRPPELTHRQCTVQEQLEFNETAELQQQSGAGTELRKILHSLGASIQLDCKCAKRIRAMNERGTEWCRQNVALIVEWLAQAARQQDILSYKITPLKVWKATVKQIVLQAIRRAEV